MTHLTQILFLLLLQQQHLVLTNCGQAFFGRHPHPRPHHTLLTDKAALLAFKRTVTFDPNSTLANWEETVDVCNFTGVICDKKHHRVAKLRLLRTGLVGRLSPLLSNLTALRVVQLVENQFFGTIPPEFSSLRHLSHLLLDLNNLDGSIPESLALLSNLYLVTLMGNNLSGTIPASFFSNCTQLKNVDLGANFFTGKIPKEIGNCPNLWNINLYGNNLTGELPVSITNASQLLNLDVESNQLSGELPSEIVGKLPELLYLHLSYNNMISHDHNTNLDPLFTALANCTSLEELQLAGMGLGGRLPNSIGRLGVNLTDLSLQENQILGSIPPSLANLSNLQRLILTSNLLNGTLPAEITRLSRLERLFLSHNRFTGAIPAVLGQCPHLGLLDLSTNRFSGQIPESLGNLVQLSYLFLNNNLLSGTIPPSLGQCLDLYKLDLSYNRLTGRIPPEISGIREIRIFLNLSHNLLEGPLPIELSKLKNVLEMDLSFNNLTGSVFPQISSCIALTAINFSHNSLQGQLPESLGDLWNLESFDVSGNNLSGKIPTSLNKIQTLTILNLSFNNFDAMIPTGGIFNSTTNLSFLGNHHLCGSVSGMPICSPKRHWFDLRMFLIIICSVVSGSILCVISFPRIRGMFFSGKVEAVTVSTPELMHNIPRITYRELSEATGRFDEQRLIGSGSYGRVFKGILPDKTAIAVKVLHLQTGNSTKCFNRECQVLRGIRHRNLIRIITVCSLPDFKALVLPYMKNGSLDCHLYPLGGNGLGSDSSSLSLIQRVNICSDIAEGVAYLHHHSPVRVIHCDLKPSNVLLNEDMTALVSDFGMARLVMTAGAVDDMGNSTANMLHGSIGYIAPEYGIGSSTSTRGDVYSFGILVLEMVTGKRPTDDMFVGGLSLHKWVKCHYNGRVEKVIDSSLVRASRAESPKVKKMWEIAVRELIELGILCTLESPHTRPTMLDAADDLDRLKRYLRGDTHAIFASPLGI